MKKLHYFSGLIISIFIVIHLTNHIFSLAGIEQHIAFMDAGRKVYRNVIVESILLLAILLQIISGVKLFLKRRKSAKGFFPKLQIYSGLYMAIFFVFHLTAVFGGRLILDLDTNVYFGIAGLNTFPHLLFFVPYYGLGICSFFAHVAAIHFMKMRNEILGVSPKNQAYVILYFGVAFAVLTFYGLTDGFSGVEIPVEYDVLLGR